jgi:hypothetical protein
MKTTLSIITSIIITSVTLMVLALCISLTFGLAYTDVSQSVPFGIIAFFTSIAMLIYSGHETYELLEKKGY